MKNQRESDYYEIDLLHLAKLLWSRVWLIVAAAAILGVLSFAYVKLFVTPRYEASTLMYVNNSASSGGESGGISSSEINAAKSLVDTYAVILKSRTTLEAVINQTGVRYSYEQLSRMVRASSVNKTEFLSVTVNSTDPKEAKLIADAIADVLPDKISSVVEGSKVSVVDRAVLSNRRVSPNVKKYVEVGALLGLLLSSAAIILRDLFDDIIHDDGYLMQTYDTPVLGVIPDLISGTEGQTSYGERTARRQTR